MTSRFKLSPLSSLYTFTVAGFHDVSQQLAKKQLTIPTGLLPGSSYCTFSHHSVDSQATPPNSLSVDHTEIKLRTEAQNKRLGAMKKAHWLTQVLCCSFLEIPWPDPALKHHSMGKSLLPKASGEANKMDWKFRNLIGAKDASEHVW